MRPRLLLRSLPTLRGPYPTSSRPLLHTSSLYWRTSLSTKASENKTAPAPAKPLPPLAKEDQEPDPKNATPPQLSRPIGVPRPPRMGENSGIDPRSWSQRRDDFVNWDKHLVKRERLANEMSKSYFRDFSNMSKQFKGKSWFAPTSIFRADKALYFPNLIGRTLLFPERVNTTTTLAGRVSVVALFSSTWAERQVATFMDSLMESVPELKSGAAQRVDINVEENWLKAMLVKIFIGGLRKRFPVTQHNKYFLVTKGLTSDLRHSMGLWNGRVGYVYLLDEYCKIRWAGSGVAEPHERAALEKGLTRLVAQQKAKRAEKALEAEKEKAEKAERTEEGTVKRHILR